MYRTFAIFILMLVYYKYPLKVWLTTMLLGIISTPCWLFLWCTFWLTKKKNLRQIPAKLLVLTSGLIAYLILFSFLYSGYEFPLLPGNADVFFSYAFVLVIAMLAFKFNVNDRRPALN
jgi:RsiW-degrading membrane proteinase PrsW (M82 family)